MPRYDCMCRLRGCVFRLLLTLTCELSVLLLIAVKYQCQCFSIVLDKASVESLEIHSCQVHAPLYFVHLSNFLQ